MPVSEKTVYRDICLLRQAGVIQSQFSKKRNAFVPLVVECPPPVFLENKSQKLYPEKLIRLCTLMREMDSEDDPVLWYRVRYPTLSVRTRQRDFVELTKIGYRVVYDREGYDRKPNCYYCDFPYDTYGLKSFHN